MLSELIAKRKRLQKNVGKRQRGGERAKEKERESQKERERGRHIDEIIYRADKKQEKLTKKTHSALACPLC